MKIIVEEKEKITTFSNLKKGDVFILPDVKNPDVFIKFSKVHQIPGHLMESLLEGVAEPEDLADHESNAYNLNLNEFGWFDPDNEVVKVEAELNIHR